MVNRSDQHHQFFECSLPLSYWAKGTDYFNQIITEFSDYMFTLNKLNIWFKKGLLIPKPTWSSSTRLFFLVNDSIIDIVMQLKGISGGYRDSRQD